MSKRLEITVFGTYYVVGAVHLTSDAMQAGINIYGNATWRQHVTDVAIGLKNKEFAQQLSHTIGHPLPVVYQQRGIAMQGDGFGVEVFYGGNHHPLAVVEAKNRTLQPSRLMQEYKSYDMLGVFRSQRDGAMSFRWDSVDELNPEDVVVVYDSLTKLIPGMGPFDLAVDVTWRNRDGRRPELRGGRFSEVKHVFHKVR